MVHPAIARFIAELKKAGLPYLTTDTQVVCGRVTLTASPGIEAEAMLSLRLDLPADGQPSESAYWLLFLVALFDAKTFCELRPCIRASTHATGEFCEVIHGWRLRLFEAADGRVMLAEATCPPAA